MARLKYFTVPQLAAKVGVSRIAVYNKVRRGQIKADKVGRIYLIPAREAEAFLAGKPTAGEKKLLRTAVRRAVREYGPVLEWLSKC